MLSVGRKLSKVDEIKSSIYRIFETKIGELDGKRIPTLVLDYGIVVIL